MTGIELNRIYNMDCLEGMKLIPDGSVDLVVADPPYELQQKSGAGAFGRKNRAYHQGIDHMQSGISNEMLDEMVRVCKHPNLYLFCSKEQLPQLLNYAVSHSLKYDLLTWHKTNPVPTCNNKYLSDTEYIVFMRKGANLYGSYHTKRKYYISKTNVEDKKLYGHPTCKPLEIIRNFVVNSTETGGVVLDPFIGSGTTAVAALMENRNYIGFELEEKYFLKSVERIQDEIRRRNEK